MFWSYLYATLEGNFYTLGLIRILNTDLDLAAQMNTDPYRIDVIDSIIERFSVIYLALRSLNGKSQVYLEKTHYSYVMHVT
jgi:hypothetical protein